MKKTYYVRADSYADALKKVKAMRARDDDGNTEAIRKFFETVFDDIKDFVGEDEAYSWVKEIYKAHGMQDDWKRAYTMFMNGEGDR